MHRDELLRFASFIAAVRAVGLSQIQAVDICAEMGIDRKALDDLLYEGSQAFEALTHLEDCDECSEIG